MDPASKTNPEPTTPPAIGARDRSPIPRKPRSKGLLAGLKIRKKLFLLHTGFSLALAVILIAALRPAVAQIVARAEADKADLVLQLHLASDRETLRVAPEHPVQGDIEAGRVLVSSGSADDLGLSATSAALLASLPGTPGTVRRPGGGTTRAIAITGDRFLLAEVRLPGVRNAVTTLYLLLTAALLVIYGLIVVAIEVLVLPRHVYGPIRTMLRADRAVQERDHRAELIPEDAIPADEIGSIMRSRNAAIRKLREQEAAAADALDRLESVAADLKRKNHLLETARRNLEDADRLASLGTMSAGIAHELNTPLAVAKGLVDRLAADPGKGLSDTEAALLARVIGRLERLGDSLLDFARARPPESCPTVMRDVVEEAVTLVRLDRGRRGIEIANDVPDDLVVNCDGDRMIQVFVNLARNAVDILSGTEPPDGEPASVRITGESEERDGAVWASLRVTDNGPGIDPALLPTLFEPFVSTRLDARGTGLGLAVAEGIVREHTGVLIATNRTDGRGAVFEVLLPGVVRSQTGIGSAGPVASDADESDADLPEPHGARS